MANKKSSKEDIEKKEDVAQTFVYIGPTIPQLSILKHKLFKNGLSPECKKLISHILVQSVCLWQPVILQMQKKTF